MITGACAGGGLDGLAERGNRLGEGGGVTLGSWPLDQLRSAVRQRRATVRVTGPIWSSEEAMATRLRNGDSAAVGRSLAPTVPVTRRRAGESRPARVGAEGQRRHRRRRLRAAEPAAGAAGHALGVPTGCGVAPVGGVLGGRQPMGELVARWSCRRMGRPAALRTSAVTVASYGRRPVASRIFGGGRWFALGRASPRCP